VRSGHAKKDPIGSVEIVGKKRRGKPQLRIDEARTLLIHALRTSDEAKPNRERVGALAVATALLLGLRNGEVVDRKVRDLDDGGRVLVIDESKTAAGIRNVEVPEVLRDRLAKMAEGRAAAEQLFPKLTRDKLRYWTTRLCQEANLPLVTPHGLRGTNATASMRANRNPHEVAAALGHASIHVTLRHYADPQQVLAARQEVAVNRLLPSKSSSKTLGHDEQEDSVEESRTLQ
jgi:integrase